MPDQGDVKIGNLWRHKSTIVAAIAKYPAKRARALSTVLELEYGLLVKWKALQTYVLREDLWTTKRPKPPSPYACFVFVFYSRSQCNRYVYHRCCLSIYR